MSSPARRRRSSRSRSRSKAPSSAGRSVPSSDGDLARGVRASSPQPLDPPSTPGMRTPGSHVPTSPASIRPSSVGRTPSSAAFGSPIARGDLAPPSRFRRTPGSTPSSGRADLLDSEAMEPTSEITDQALIWGTTVSVPAAMKAFEQFFSEYTREDEDKPHYPQLLRELALTDTESINIDCTALSTFNDACAKLYGQLICYPQEIIPIMDLVVNDSYAYIAANEPGSGSQDPSDAHPRIQVRLHNLRREHVRRMRDLNPPEIDSLVSIKGMVIRTSSIIPDLRLAYFRCSNCGWDTEVQVDRGRVDEPTICGNCSMRHSCVMVHNRCVFKDKQLVKLQETPESVPEGETPHTITLYAFDDLVDVAVPGDRVVVTGVYRAVPFRTNPRHSNLNSVFKTHVDVIHFKKMDKARLAAEEPSAVDGEFKPRFAESDDTAELLAQHREEMLAMSDTPDLYMKMAQSLAPSIWEMNDVKKGLLLQLFGGSLKDLNTDGKFRGEINVLLCGDPGTSKSQLLSYVNKIAPRGIYTSGKGSSAVGLTAYITKDPETREPVLESGALVLSDRGICCIDEFDKMSDATRSILHEVMEQQTVSIAKAGIICTLNARTSVLASANPVESRYNPKLSVVENLKLPPTLLSRFDLIYLVLDKCTRESDRQLAQHLVSLYYEEDPEAADPAPFNLEQMTKYISFAKAHYNPGLSEEAGKALVDGYKALRAHGYQGGKKTITATPRQLESLIRLSEAHARLHLREVVEADDVKEAIRLMKVATLQSAMDPRTGHIDMGRINTGFAGEDDTPAELSAAILEIYRGMGRNRVMPLGTLMGKLLETQHYDQAQVENAVRVLVERFPSALEARGSSVKVKQPSALVDDDM